MDSALFLAKRGLGLTSPNPSVGCIIVKKGEVISRSWTSVGGTPHAEFNAIKNAGSKARGSTAYITLEPCSHFGKTPPCTKAIIKSKVKKVYYSVADSDLRSSNNSKRILRSKRIIVKSGLLQTHTKRFYKNYDYIRKHKMPYVTGKLACSSNYHILKNKKSITNEHSRKVSHLLRYQNQAILTSYKTINSDNPKLSCRINGLEKFSPTRLIIDKNLKIKMNSYIISSSSIYNTIIFHSSSNTKKITNLKNKKIKLIYLKLNNYGKIDLKTIFKKIYNLGMHNVLVECGCILTNNILKEKLFNEFYLFKSSKKMIIKNSIDVRNISKNINSAFKNKENVNTYLDKDKLLHYY